MGHRSKRHRAATAARLADEQRTEDCIEQLEYLARRHQNKEMVKLMAEGCLGRTREQRRQNVRAARGLDSPAYDKAKAKEQARTTGRRNIRQSRMRGCAGAIKWHDGIPTVSYVKSGYRLIGKDYVKVDPRATGIVQVFEGNRAGEREHQHKLDHPEPEQAGWARPRSARSRAKQAGREKLARALAEQKLQRRKAREVTHAHG